jgi:hypothetical protein
MMRRMATPHSNTLNEGLVELIPLASLVLNCVPVVTLY